MMLLADALGRQRAHDVIHRTALAVTGTGTTFAEALSQNEAVTEHLTPEQIRSLLDPATHIGCSSAIALDTAQRVRATLSGLSDPGRAD